LPNINQSLRHKHIIGRQAATLCLSVHSCHSSNKSHFGEVWDVQQGLARWKRAHWSCVIGRQCLI